MTRTRSRPSLLVPGWAGELTTDELSFIRIRLRASAELREQWGIHSTRFSNATIRRVALEGVNGGTDHGKNGRDEGDSAEGAVVLGKKWPPIRAQGKNAQKRRFDAH